MAYTTKELTQKYETLWEQVDGLYRETSGLKEYVIDIDSKYDSLWSKCNVNADEILIVKEHAINKGRDDSQLTSVRFDMSSLQSKVDSHVASCRADVGMIQSRVDSQISAIQFDVGHLQSKIRAFDKMEEEHIAMMSNISYDMYSVNANNAKTKDYIDNKFANLYARSLFVIVIIFIYTVC